MLPVSDMNELKTRPTSDVDALAEIADRFNGKWSTIGQHSPFFLKAMRTDLVKITNASINTLLNECAKTMTEELGAVTDWSAKNVQSLTTKVVTKMIGTLVAGHELGCDDVWLQLA